MRRVHVADIFEYEHGETIPMVQGELVEVYEHKTGTYKNGKSKGKEWCLQNAYLQDGEAKIKVLFRERDDVSGFKGKVIQIISKDGSRGLSGVYAEEDTYKHDQDPKNPIEVMIKVTPSAELAIIQDEEPQHTQRTSRRNEAQPRRESQREPRNSAPQDAPPATDQLLAVKHELLQAANLYHLCMGAVHRVIEPVYFDLYGREMPDAMAQAATSSLFIKMDRSGAVSKMPKRPLEAPAPTRQAPPVREPEPEPERTPADEPIDEDNIPF